MNRARKLIELTQADAIEAAVQEMEDLISGGANVDTQHELRDMANFIAQKHGVSPDVITSRIKIQKKKDYVDFDTIIKKAWDLTMQRLPAPIAEKVRNLTLKIKDRDPEVPALDGISYGEPTKGFIIYQEGQEIRKGRVSNIMQILAHEMFHIFAEVSNFYDNLGDVLEGKIDHWGKYGISDVQEFVSFLDMAEFGSISNDFLRKLKQKIIDRKFWGEKYFLDGIEEWEVKKILSGIKSKTFLGSIDELMAESLGRIVAGKSLFVPRKFIDFILKMS
jgi:hypothetical protein